MISLEKYFDHYVIAARFRPILFISVPAILTTLAWYPEFKNLEGTIISFLITCGIFSFLSNAISDKGNEIQTTLFSKWGGAPTTILLRHRDYIIDPLTKLRYHKWLNTKLKGVSMPTPEEESSNNSEADKKYISAVSFLREFTRDTNKYSMIYRDNVAYGFSRNLYALKKYAIVISSLCVSINSFFMVLLVGSHGLFFHDTSILFCIFTLGCSLLFVFFWGLYLSEDYVYSRAVRYAKSLLAVCETE